MKFGADLTIPGFAGACMNFSELELGGFEEIVSSHEQLARVFLSRMMIKPALGLEEPAKLGIQAGIGGIRLRRSSTFDHRESCRLWPTKVGSW